MADEASLERFHLYSENNKLFKNFYFDIHIRSFVSPWSFHTLSNEYRFFFILYIYFNILYKRMYSYILTELKYNMITEKYVWFSAGSKLNKKKKEPAVPHITFIST